MSKLEFSKLSPYKAPEESPGFLLWKVSTLWRRAIEASLKPLDLTHPQFVVLAAIGWLTRTKPLVRQIEIARQAGLDANTTSQILKGLQKKKWITRDQAGDERSKYPSLTPAGKEVLKKAFPAVEGVNAVFFGRINCKEDSFLDALQYLVE